MVNKEKSIAYYVSAHGYGHGVRSTDILRALFKQASPRVVITTALPVEFLRNRLGTMPVEFRNGTFDVGMVQKDSIRVDVEATFRRVEELCSNWDRLVEHEAQWLRERSMHLVVCDIPAIPVSAAKRVGIPAVVVANFSWDWIYDEFAERDSRWRPFVECFAQAYAQSSLLLRAPFSPDMATFPHKVDIPLVAAPGRVRREDLAKISGADPHKPWVLLSFTTLEWSDEALNRIETLTSYEFFTVQPLEWRRRNVHAINRDVIPFSDVLATVDIVVSKPGYGLLSECVVNNKPLIYADRSDFREYALLVREMKRYLRCVHIPTEQLYRGELESALASVARACEPPEKLVSDGGESAAKWLLSAMRGS